MKNNYKLNYTEINTPSYDNVKRPDPFAWTGPLFSPGLKLDI